MKLVGCLTVVLVLVSCEPSVHLEDGERAARAWGKAMGIEDPGVACDAFLPFYCAVSDNRNHVIHSLRCDSSSVGIRCALRSFNQR